MKGVRVTFEGDYVVAHCMRCGALLTRRLVQEQHTATDMERAAQADGDIANAHLEQCQERKRDPQCRYGPRAS
jgi:hypothetical protein